MASSNQNLKTAQPDGKLINLTPARAKELLSLNSHNRDLRDKAVEHLEGVITRGEWRLTNDAISISKDGTLLNGQHRCWAVVNTDVAVPILLVTGMDPASQEAMDLGVRRGLKDSLKLRGESNAGQLAAAINYLYRYLNGWVRDTNVRPSIPQGIALYEEYPTIRQAMDTSRGLGKKFRIPIGVATASRFEFDSIDPQVAEEFFGKLYTGTDLSEGDPILVLRTWLENHLVGGGKGAADAIITHAMIIKAWNFYRDGRKIGSLIWKATGMKAEAFPEPY